MAFSLGTAQGAVHTSGTTVDTPSVTIPSATYVGLVAAGMSGWFSTPTALPTSAVFDPGGANETTLTPLTIQTGSNTSIRLFYSLSVPAGASGVVRLTYAAAPDENGIVAAQPFSADGPITYEAEGGASAATLGIATAAGDFVFGALSEGNGQSAAAGTNTTDVYGSSYGGVFHSGHLATADTVSAGTTTLAWTGAVAPEIVLARFSEGAAASGPTFNSGPTVDQITQGGARIRATGDLP